MSERLTGTVKWFDPSKGYGYIDAGLGKDVFVYYQEITGSGFKNLSAGDQVEFSMTQKPRGPIVSEVVRV